jgi:selenide,water dikinase
VGLDTSDDAGVLKLSDDLAIIQTVDFFTPVVDDPYSFGLIAAANALSDVYAMGGIPITAMNIIGFPVSTMDISVLQEVLRGGLDKIKEAGALLLGGHSIEDDEFKYGLSVTGKVHPDKVVTNRGARPGDLLVLTKPLGTGIINTAIKGNIAGEDLVDRAVKIMSSLNKESAEEFKDFNISACTDVTGFGFIGHACEMIDDNSAGIKIYKENIPIIPEAVDFAQMGIVPGGSLRNKKYREHQVEGIKDIDPVMVDILFDPQTSGGLLIALPENEANIFVKRIQSKGLEDAAVVGEFTDYSTGKIII